MLDPFTALSLAGNIIQFLDLGYKILSNGVELYKTGANEGQHQLEIITTDLVALTDRIDAEAKQVTVLGSEISAEDASIHAVAAQTYAVSTELVDALKKVHVTGKHSKINSLRQALRNFLSEEKLNEIGRRLDNLRSELNLRVLVSLKKSNAAQSIRQDARLKGLDAGLQNVIHEILDGKAEIVGRIDQTAAVLLQQLQDHHSELMNAIPTLSASDTALARRSEAAFSLELTQSQRTVVEQIILDNLKYRSILDREYEIKSPHEETYQWILSDTSPMHEGGQNLVSWLQNGSEIYWIRGKAASGKSTLMKFIAGSGKTGELLTAWAGQKRLLIASFYFWNIGTLEQKSQRGLLRSLLLSLLRENRSYIQQTMPEIYREISQGFRSNDRPKTTEPPSEAEIKMAFLRFVQKPPADLRVCLFLDGLDEYEGEVSELLELVLAVASENFKMVLSSRPISSCITVLGKYPHLRLEVLTRSDILSYTKRHLLQHPNVKYLQQENPTDVDELIQQVTQKSDGVFLWVTLVVKLLLKSLDDNDGIEKLRAQLDALPRDLELLYRHMMGQMKESHQKEASWYMQLVLRSIEVQNAYKFNLMQCWMSEWYTEDRSAALSRVNDSLPTFSIWWDRMNWMEGRLIGLCCGLVEAVVTSGSSRQVRLPVVAFIHKSVADFLRQPEIWNFVTNLTNDKKSEVYHVLATSSLMYPKSIKKHSFEIHSAGEPLSEYMKYCLKYLRAAGTSDPCVVLETFSDLRAIRTDPPFVSSSPVGDVFCFLKMLDHGDLPESRANLRAAAHSMLPLYFKHMHARCELQDRGICLIDESWLLCSLLDERQVALACTWGCLPELMQIITFLLQQGVDVNAKMIDNRSAWQQLLIILQKACDKREGEHYVRNGVAIACIDLIPASVHSGASWHNRDVVLEIKPGTTNFQSAVEIVQTLKINMNEPERSQFISRQRSILAEMSKLQPDRRPNEEKNKFMEEKSKPMEEKIKPMEERSKPKEEKRRRNQEKSSQWRKLFSRGFNTS